MADAVTQSTAVDDVASSFDPAWMDEALGFMVARSLLRQYAPTASFHDLVQSVQPVLHAAHAEGVALSPTGLVAGICFPNNADRIAACEAGAAGCDSAIRLGLLLVSDFGDEPLNLPQSVGVPIDTLRDGIERCFAGCPSVDTTTLTAVGPNPTVGDVLRLLQAPQSDVVTPQARHVAAEWVIFCAEWGLRATTADS